MKELIKRGNNLSKGCILVSSKKELRTFYRIPVESVEENERGNLVEIMASRMRKKVGEEEKKKVEEIAEGHPIATYLLVSNLGRIPVKRLKRFKEGLDFSQDEDVKEYMKRVIESGISPEAYEFLKDLSAIEEEIEEERLYEALSGFPYSKEILGKLFDASIMERVGNTIVWKYSQIREAVFEDVPERHGLVQNTTRENGRNIMTLKIELSCRII